VTAAGFRLAPPGDELAVYSLYLAAQGLPGRIHHRPTEFVKHHLHGLFLQKSLPSGAPATYAQIRDTILVGRGTMPAFDQRLREEDVDGLIRYLRQLR